MSDDIESQFYLELLRAYIDSTDDALFVLCDEMKFLLCNHAGESYFGVSEEILIKHNQRTPVSELFTDSETSELFIRKYPDVLAGKTVKFESYMKPRSAQSKWVEFNLNRVAVENVPMVIVVARDITDRKDFEHELQNQKTTLEALVEERTAELMLANQHKDKLLSIIAHDLRSPISPILGYAELIINDANNLSAEALRRYATNIHISGKQSLNLLTDLLDWSRLQLDSLRLTKKQIDIKSSAQNVVNQLAYYAVEKNITLTNNIPSQHVYADRYIVETILRNLINNAIKFTPAGGTISLEIEQHDNINMVSVTDTGVGMSDKELESVLSAHSYKSSTGTGGEKGTGLGLPLCISLIKKHGGVLNASSTLGKGSTFCFTVDTE